MGAFLESLGNLVSRIWEGGQALIWGCAAASLLVFALLYCGRYIGLPNAAGVFATDGLWVLIAFVVFTALAGARTWETRSQKALFFVSNEEQSLWGHARQQSGEVYTNFNFRMAVTNMSEGAAHLSKPRIAWPSRARWSEHVTAVLITENNVTFHGSQEFAIQPHERARVSGVIALKGKLYDAGRRLSFTVSVADHMGRRYRIKFKHVRSGNPTPV